MGFEEACSEVSYILEHMDPNDIKKIPQNVREFFKENKSPVYKVRLDVSKELEEQNLRDETKAFIQIINAKYLAGESEKKQLEALLKEEVLKKSESKTDEKQMILYKESKIIKWIKSFLAFFKKG